jgi:hypothetical protein
MVLGPLTAVVLLAAAPAAAAALVPTAGPAPQAVRADAPQDAEPAKPGGYGLPLEGEEAEAFLRAARVVSRSPIGSGVTQSERLVLSDGTRQLRAAWKTVDLFKPGTTRFQDGTVEMDFRDSWKFELAAYELDKLLELGLVPPVVERTIDGKTGSLQAWVEGATTEDERRRRGAVDPDADHWNRQMYNCRLLHQLTYNTDYRNVRNVLVDPSFRVYVIDFSRAFRTLTFLMASGDLDRFSRATLERLERLDEPTLRQRVGRWLLGRQISGLLKRRDQILDLARRRVQARGEAAVLLP